MCSVVVCACYYIWVIGAGDADIIDVAEQEADQYRRILSVVLSRLDRMAAQVTEERNRSSRSSKSPTDSEETDDASEKSPVKSVRFRVNGAVTGPEKPTKEVIDCGWKVLLDAAFFGNKEDSVKRYQAAVQQITLLQEDYEAAVSERDAMVRNTRLTSQKVHAMESDNLTLRDILLTTHQEKEECVVQLSMERSAAEESMANVMTDLESMRKEVDKLKQERDTAIEGQTMAQDKLRRACDKMAKMGERLDNALSERDRILDENVVALSKCGELSQTTAMSKKERDLLADEKRMLEVRLRSLEEEYGMMTNSRDKFDRLRREKEELNLKLEGMQIDYRTLKDQYEWSLKECNKALLKSEGLRKDIRSLALARDSAVANRTEVREEVERYRAQQVIWQAEVQSLKSELECANQKLSMLRSVMDSPKLGASSESLVDDSPTEKQLLVRHLDC